MGRRKLCRCGKVIGYRDSYCEECSSKIEAERKEYHETYDRHSRNRENADFYNSYEWKMVRLSILSKFNGLDLYAYFVDNEIIHADTVHHINELETHWEQRLDIDNLFPCTIGSHTKIHKLYEKNKKETKLLLFNLLKKWEGLYG